MPQIIGSDLNQQQIDVLQSVAHNSGGARYGRLSGLYRTAESYRGCDAVIGMDRGELERLLAGLEAAGLIELRVIRGEAHAGLTPYGSKCNLIDTYDD